jgi:hypothetical protein
MRSPSFITVRKVFSITIAAAVLAGSALSGHAQRVAVIAPDGDSKSTALAERLSDELRPAFRMVDVSLAASAFASTGLENRYNLATEDAKRVGAVVGSDLFVLVRWGSQPRLSLAKGEYHEVFAAIFVVSSRTGRLEHFGIRSFESKAAIDAEELFNAGIGKAVQDLKNEIRAAYHRDIERSEIKGSATVPDEETAAAEGLRTPVPYRRIRPEYTPEAHLYDVRATVDIEVDIADDGRILLANIVRWAGYGLDESVEKAVRSMNWRPAERRGRPLPMRVLLRYNFTKAEKEQ